MTASTGNHRVPDRGPHRIQRRRVAGWQMPPDAVYVGRPTKWGNPYRPVLDGSWWVVLDDNGVDYEPIFNSRESAHRRAVELFADVELGYGLLRNRVGDLTELKGRDLVCWCPLDQPCHGDVLLATANRVEVAH
ncbi:DUF4326 domain-containing protein [Saccharomonospora viridis]|uniref:DUF4326 domain-containing protein n=1 Tax=Saccharomonospora viridis TaxID=1852 RepID=UPI0023F25CBB|nr:DUF4326 domain-containing protein [Saccharomonospora viridis]